MKNIRNITWFVVICFCALTSVYAQSPIQIGDGQRLFIGKNLEYFIDSSQNLQVKDLNDKVFTACQSEILNLGNTPYPVWMRFSATSETEKELYLELAAPLLAELEVYEVSGESSKNLFSGGTSKPFHKRPIVSEKWLLEIKLNDSLPSVIYIKAQSFYPLQIPIVLSAKNKLIENNQFHYLFWGLYVGIMIFAFIYNFFIYLSVRDRTYLYYLLYIITSTAFYLGLEGFGFQFLWSNSPGFNPLIPILVSITNITITIFTLRFLSIDKKQKALYYTGRAFIIIFVLLAILNFAGFFLVVLPLSQLFSLLVCVYFIITGINSIRRGFRTAKFFLIAWSTYLLTVILFILTLNNIVPSNFITTHGIFFGHMSEVLLLSFALADRINLLRMENETKQKEIILQHEVNNELQTKVNRELEQKVTERTAEVVEQRERSEKLLLNILPEEIAEELKAKGSADAKLIDFATVLFTDFKGFTALSEILSPEKLVNDINVCFSAFDFIMERHNIEKIKTIGDSYMAAGGLPTVNETHALDVVRAAMEIQTFMDNLVEQKKANNEPFFEIRIGVHTGPVVAGIVGVKKFQYDIWGDTVNTASRMESSGAVGMVNISEMTYNIIKDHGEYDFESRGKIEAKGKGLMEMFFVHKK